MKAQNEDTYNCLRGLIHVGGGKGILDILPNIYHSNLALRTTAGVTLAQHRLIA
jgi:hypothetical protein